MSEEAEPLDEFMSVLTEAISLLGKAKALGWHFRMSQTTRSMVIELLQPEPASPAPPVDGGEDE